MGTLDKAGLF